VTTVTTTITDGGEGRARAAPRRKSGRRVGTKKWARKPFGTKGAGRKKTKVRKRKATGKSQKWTS